MKDKKELDYKSAVLSATKNSSISTRLSDERILFWAREQNKNNI